MHPVLSTQAPHTQAGTDHVAAPPWPWLTLHQSGSRWPLFSYQCSSDVQTPLKYEPSAMSNRTQAAELDSKDP